MNISLLRWSTLTAAIALLTLSSGCAVTGGGYGYDSGVGIGVDYYEPYGGYYGGWGAGYRVGPVRNGEHRSEHRDEHPSQHAYRPSPSSHSMPSIPSRPRSRSGGSRSH